MKKDTYIKGAGLAALGGVFWALSASFGQFVFEYRGFEAEWLTSVRLIFAGSIMLIIALIKDRKNFFNIWKAKKDIFEILLYGIIGMMGVQLTYFKSIQFSNGATGTIIQYTGSVVVVLYTALRYLKLPDKYEFTAVLISVAGIFLLSTHGDINALVISKPALAWGLSSAVLMAFYTIQPRRMLKKFGTLATNGWGMFIGGIVMCFIRQPWQLGAGQLDLKAVFSVGGVILFGTILSFFCFMEGVRIIGSAKAVLYACVEPLTAAIIGIVYFKIAFGVIDWIGALLIVSTVFIISLAPKKPVDRPLE